MAVKSPSAGLPGDPGWTGETEREALRLTLDALGLERPHLVGWSGGGKAALEFATEYPDRVRSLTLVEPAAYWILEQLGDRGSRTSSARTRWSTACSHVR
jgi:pimeloyl-ACP methyl ester carboxylesterase